MGHEDRGHYAEKHEGAAKDNTICEMIQKKSDQGKLSCAAAHSAAKQLGVTSTQIGIQTDLLELCISKCQLGLFGHEPEKKKLDPNYQLSDQTEAALDQASEGGRISCQEAWKLAKELGITRLEMGSACEIKRIRIKPCQLGAF